jgi:hypothetical protein
VVAFQFPFLSVSNPSGLKGLSVPVRASVVPGSLDVGNMDGVTQSSVFHLLATVLL